MPYLNEVTNAKTTKITKLYPRPKGLLLAGESYDCFLYKSNKLCIKLMELYTYFRENEEHQCELFIVPNKKAKVGFDIELGNPIRWYMTEDYVTLDPEEDEQEIDFIVMLQDRIVAPSQLSSTPKSSSTTVTKSGRTKLT